MQDIKLHTPFLKLSSLLLSRTLEVQNSAFDSISEATRIQFHEPLDYNFHFSCDNPSFYSTRTDPKEARQFVVPPLIKCAQGRVVMKCQDVWLLIKGIQECKSKRTSSRTASYFSNPNYSISSPRIVQQCLMGILLDLNHEVMQYKNLPA